MKKLSFLLAMLVFVCFQSHAQVTITGLVTSSEDGAPVPGASVVVDGTTIGTVTEADGSYSLEVPETAETLVFSFVGMRSQEVDIDDRTTIDVQLVPDVVGLDEVVVTALGISREKKSLGYSVQEVSADDLDDAAQTDALSALHGRVSGVQISSSTSMGGSNRVLIRGAKSITSENRPLIVVDGIPIDNSNFNSSSANAGYGGYDYGDMLNDINPENIESISVLKGGAASALYGSRAANGVLVITTKQAQTGVEDFAVEVNSKLGFEQVYLLPQLQRKYGGGTVISDADGGINGFQQVTIDGSNYLVPQYQVDESWGPKYDPNVEVLHWNAFSPESYPEDYLNPRPWVAPDNDVIDFYEMGRNFTNSFAIRQSGQDYGVRFSYTNTDVKGTMPNSSQDKNNFSLSGKVNLLDRLSVDANLNYINQYTKGRPELGYGDNSVGQKFFQWGQRQLDYEELKDYKENDGDQRTWNRLAWDNPNPKYSDNPYWIANENYPDDERDRFYGKVSLSYELLDNLFLKGSAYGDNYTFYVRERVAVGSQATPRYYEAVRNNSEYNYEGMLSYSRQLQDINLSGFAGVNQRKYRLDMNRGESSGGLVVPEIYSLLNSADDPLTNDYTEEKQVNSVFGNVAFDYRSMVYLEGTFRNDWSSTLPEDENSYFYPSVSASFVFSEVTDFSWLSFGKIRVNWAQTGNDTDPYRVINTYLYTQPPTRPGGSFQGTPRLWAEDDLPNIALKAEQTTSTEFGIDLAFFNNRLELAATYFNDVTTDQIMPLEVSKSTGYDSKFINAGEMQNSGIELTAGLVPLDINDFQWRIFANYTKINNELTKLYKDIEAIDIQRAPFGGVFLRASLGDRYGMLWGTDYIYDDDGNKVVGDNGHYLATPDLVPLGSVIPDFNLGIRNTFSYKNIDFNVLFDIQQGGKYYSISHMWGMYSGMLEETAQTNDKGNEIRDPVSEDGGIKLDGVKGDVTFNDDGTYEVTNTTPNDTYVSAIGWGARHYHGYGTPSAQSTFDADYIKLREVSIGYTLPNAFSGVVENIRVGLYGRNLLTFGLDQPGFDPEMATTGSGNVQGFDGGLMPTARTFGLNLQLQF